MTRSLKLLILLGLFTPLSACGIKGNLKTPPPVWGDKPAAVGTDQAGESAPEEAPDDSLAEDEEDDVGYGIDVADTP